MVRKGRTHVKVKGLNQERTINKIVKTIKIYNYNRIEHNLCEFEVDFSNRKLLTKMLKDDGLEIESMAHYGISSSFKKLACSYGIIVALVLISIFYCLQYAFVLKIDVYGLDKNISHEIVDFVDDNLKSRYKNKIDTKQIEVNIKENFEEVSSISVAIVGQTLIININESVIPDEMKEGEAIVSQFDGLITDINLIQGTLVVDVGDIVQKGDILVQPYIIDAEGEQRVVTPKAEIFADVWLNGRENHYDHYFSTERTGNKVVKSEIYLGNILLYSNRSQLPFKEFDVEESKVCITKNNILPLFRNKVTYYETITREVEENFSQVQEQIIDKARKKALIFLRENEIIKEENYTIREEDGFHEVEFVLTVNRNIGG